MNGLIYGENVTLTQDSHHPWYRSGEDVSGPDGRSYTYDDATNILKTAGEWTLTHDALGHTTEADGFGIKTAHAYDVFGNAISHLATPNGSAVPPSFNNFTFDPLPNNQIPGLEKNGAATGWNTNLRGEATLMGFATSSTSSIGFGWDGLGLLRSAVWNSGNQTYLYSPAGYRVDIADTLNSGNSRKFTYSSGGQLLEVYVNPSGTPIWNRDVIYLGSQAVAEGDANGVHELHSDHLGSPRLITKGKGNWALGLVGTAEATQTYGAYGELISATGSYVPLTGYTGHLQADATGLIYMRGRYFSPAWHAFVNSDQGADSGTWNQRGYVGGSPFMGTDPSGMRMRYIDRICSQVSVNGSDGPVVCTDYYYDDSSSDETPNPRPDGGGGTPQTPKPPKPSFAKCMSTCYADAIARGVAGVGAGFVPGVGTAYAIVDVGTGGLNPAQAMFGVSPFTSSSTSGSSLAGLFTGRMGDAAELIKKFGDIASKKPATIIGKSMAGVSALLAGYQLGTDLQDCNKKCLEISE